MDELVDWKRIANQQEAEKLLDLTRGFHDGVVVHAIWVGVDRVNSFHELEFHGFGSLKLEVESQFEEVPCIELCFDGVRFFRYNYDYDDSGEITIQPNSVVAKLLSWELKAEGLKFRIVDRNLAIGLT